LGFNIWNPFFAFSFIYKKKKKGKGSSFIYLPSFGDLRTSGVGVLSNF